MIVILWWCWTVTQWRTFSFALPTRNRWGRGAHIQGRRLIEGEDGRLFIFSQIVVRNNWRGPVSLWELRNTTPLAFVIQLHKVDWSYLQSVSQCAMLEWVDNHLLVTEHDQNYTFFARLSRYSIGGAPIWGEALIRVFTVWLLIKRTWAVYGSVRISAPNLPFKTLISEWVTLLYRDNVCPWKLSLILILTSLFEIHERRLRQGMVWKR